MKKLIAFLLTLIFIILPTFASNENVATPTDLTLIEEEETLIKKLPFGERILQRIKYNAK